MDGQTFGELVHTIEAIPELRKFVASKPEFSLAVAILNKARPIFIHPLESQAKDVDEEDVRKITLAIETIVDVISKSSRDLTRV